MSDKQVSKGDPYWTKKNAESVVQYGRGGEFNMKYVLVLQWPGSSIKDYDAMIKIEELLEEGLSPIGEIDGHDEGSGEVNIFIHTNKPQPAFDEVKEILSDQNCWKSVRAAFREMKGNKYSVLWPKGLTEFKVK